MKNKVSISLLSVFLFFTAHAHSATHLLLVGGGKRPTDALKRFVETSGGAQAKILVIAWATEEPQNAFDDIKSELEAYSPNSITLAEYDLSLDSAHSRFLKQLAQATGVYFTGGDQNRIMAYAHRKQIHEAILQSYQSGVPIAGTSAGTAAQSELMFTGRDQGDEPELDSGVALVPKSIFDTHFLVREREERLKEAIRLNPGFYGLGVDQDNAVWIEDGHHATALGPSHASVYTRDSASKYYDQEQFELP